MYVRLKFADDESHKPEPVWSPESDPPPLLREAKLGIAEIRQAFEAYADEYPPVLDVNQAAKIARLAPGTLKRKVSEGAFRDSVKRGKPLLFWRDKFVQEFMKG